MESYTYLAHHGRKGQKWGVENGPPYPLSPSDLSARERKYTAKFKNVDGSLNEKGKDYRDKYVAKKQAKNDKYYYKYESKYQKKADKALAKGKQEDYEKWTTKKASAEESRKAVNESIKNMPIEDIVKDVRATRAKNIKTGLAIAGGAVAAGTVGGAAALYATGKVTATNLMAAIGSVSYESIRTTALTVAASPFGKKVQEIAETGLRLFADARGYATGIVVDQTIRNLKDTGALDTITNTVQSSLGNVKNAIPSVSLPKVDTTKIQEAYQIGKVYLKANGVT